MIYSVTLILDGEAADTDDFANAVYGDGRDCTPSTSAGVAKAGFDREAPSLREAVIAAIRTIHQADSSVRVVGVLTEDQPIDAAFDLAPA